MNDSTTQDHGDNDNENKGHGHEVTIHVDKSHFAVEQSSLTGSEIRHLPNPPIGDDRDLYQEVPSGEDLLIGDDISVELHNGLHFFSVPKAINPGS